MLRSILTIIAFTAAATVAHAETNDNKKYEEGYMHESCVAIPRSDSGIEPRWQDNDQVGQQFEFVMMTFNEVGYDESFLFKLPDEDHDPAWGPNVGTSMIIADYPWMEYYVWHSVHNFSRHAIWCGTTSDMEIIYEMAKQGRVIN